MKLNDIKIRTRLGALAGFLLIATIAVGVSGWLRLAESNASSTDAMQNAALLQQAADNARTAQVDFKIQIQEWKNILLRGGDPAAFEKYQTAFSKKSNETQASLQKLQDTLVQSGLDTALVKDTKQVHQELGLKYLEALKNYDQANGKSAQLVDNLVKGLDRAPTEKIDQIVTYVIGESERLMKKTNSQAQARYRSACLVLLSVIVLAVVLGIAVTYWLVQSIVKPLNTAVRVANSVASGDLTSNIKVTGKDETGQLLKALKEMNESLVGIVGEVRNGTDTIATASAQIATGNLDLSSRTEQQAASLEETASSMEELTSTVKQNADNARQANLLVVTSSDYAVQGGKVVGQVVDTMGSIKDSSRKIVDIISVIDGIAFQTNILALNAAVEAARAGEQGRGFAVVAAEVRMLAQRSAAAAKEIKELISNSVEKVDIGSRLVDEAGTTMQQIMTSVKQVADIMGEIAAATQEQTAGIEQINMAITQMDDVTQQNAALVEQASAAAQSMQNQASGLLQMVRVFRLASNENRVSAPRRIAPKPTAPAVKLAHAATVRPSALPTSADKSDWEEF